MPPTGRTDLPMSAPRPDLGISPVWQTVLWPVPPTDLACNLIARLTWAHPKSAQGTMITVSRARGARVSTGDGFGGSTLDPDSVWGEPKTTARAD